MCCGWERECEIEIDKLKHRLADKHIKERGGKREKREGGIEIECWREGEREGPQEREREIGKRGGGEEGREGREEPYFEELNISSVQILKDSVVCDSMPFCMAPIFRHFVPQNGTFASSVFKPLKQRPPAYLIVIRVLIFSALL